MATHQLAHVSFVITGDNVQPGFWTSYFHVTPDIAITKGDPVRDPTGQGRDLRRRIGVWSFSSEAAVRSDEFEPHARFVVAQLCLPRTDLRERLEQQGASVHLLCYWDNASGDRIPDVPDDIRTMMESLGGSVEIDEYR